MFRAIAIVLFLAVAAAAFSPSGPTVEERQTGHLKSAAAGVLARSALASDARQLVEAAKPAAAPAAPAAPAAKPKARALICSPTWHCPHCGTQKQEADKLTAKGYKVGKTDGDDFQYITLTDREAREKYGIRLWPTTIILGPDGKVIKSLTGVQRSDQLDRELSAQRK